MNIEIIKKDALEYLHRMSGHLGLKLHAVEQVASTPDDELRLDIMWKNVLSKLSKIMSDYAALSLHEEKAVFTLSMPPNWRAEQLDNLQLQCRAFVHNELYATWLDFVKPDAAAFNRSLNSDTQAVIVHLLELRKPPACR